MATGVKGEVGEVYSGNVRILDSERVKALSLGNDAVLRGGFRIARVLLNANGGRSRDVGW